jgi:hypothetical protein
MALSNKYQQLPSQSHLDAVFREITVTVIDTSQIFQEEVKVDF